MAPKDTNKALRKDYLERVKDYSAKYARAIQRYKAKSPHWPDKKVSTKKEEEQRWPS